MQADNIRLAPTAIAHCFGWIDASPAVVHPPPIVRLFAETGPALSQAEWDARAKAARSSPAPAAADAQPFCVEPPLNPSPRAPLNPSPRETQTAN